jgi:uncharacterized protein (TIGR02453 family)
MPDVSTLNFLKALKKNNNKPWFDEHRQQYDAAKSDMESLVQSIIDAHSKLEPGIADLKAKDCLFRINRDIRFSNDKTPYKTNLGASISAGGKKSTGAGYYIHIEPGKSFAGGGIWQPMAPELKKVRQEIDYNWEEFRSIVEGKKFRSIYGTLSDDPEYKITRVPQGFEKDSPAAAYLMYKSYVAAMPLADNLFTDKSLNKKLLEAFATLQPLIAFINRSFE